MDEGIARTALDPDAGERFVSLRRALGVTSFGINQIVLEPRQRGRIHRHERQEEVYLVLEGTLTLLVEGEEQVARARRARARRARRSAASSSTAGPSGSCCWRWAATGEHAGRDGQAWTDWDSAAERAAAGDPAARATCPAVASGAVSRPAAGAARRASPGRRGTA